MLIVSNEEYPVIARLHYFRLLLYYSLSIYLLIICALSTSQGQKLINNLNYILITAPKLYDVSNVVIIYHCGLRYC